MSKKIISLLLAVMLTVSMVAVAAVSVSAEVDDEGRYVPSEGADTFRYYFYMPSDWVNEFNEGEAGVYWWGGPDACATWQDMYKMQKADADGVFYVDVPVDFENGDFVETIIFNNYTDGGEDPEQDIYYKAAQSVDIGLFWGMGDTDTYDGQIYVIDPERIEINELNQKQTCGGKFYYYYGEGKYGENEEPVEGEIYDTEYFPPKEGDEPVDPVVTTPEASTPAESTPEESTPEETTPEETTAEAYLTVNATSNFFETSTAKYSEGQETVTVTYMLQADKPMVNTEWFLTYDPEVLKPETKNNTNEAGTALNIMPVCGKEGTVFNLTGVSGTVTGNASSLGLYDFSTSSPFVTVTFTVIGSGETTVDLDIKALSFADRDPETLQAVDGAYVRVIQQSEVNEGTGMTFNKETQLTEDTFVPVVPVVSTPEETKPEETKPEESTPVESTPEESTPVESTPEESTVPEASTDATSGTGTTVAPGSTNTNTNASNNNGAVQTGDASLAIVILTLLISASGVMFVLRKKEVL